MQHCASMHLSFRFFLFLTFCVCESLSTRNIYTNHWAVRITGGPEEADKLATKYGYNNLGQIGSLDDHYHFHHSKIVKRSAFTMKGEHNFIHMDPKVNWIQQQVVKTRVKRYTRNDLNFIHFNDPKWSNMWYIHCGDKSNRCRSEMNILAAWQRGYTGKNVVVTILDDGIEKNHPDLAQNYDSLASYDVNGNDHDPTPRYDASNENKHGTRCAGEVAAVANNSHCIVGIAYNARIGGIRMLDGDVTDMVEAKSLGIRPDYIDIYSASWGPDDDGKTVDGPGLLAKQAFEMGIKKGRKGLGSVFVWASGNGGRQGDHCSCDGYTNSIYTISVSSSTENGNKPWYLEECASTLATTYSSGEFYDRKIVTTDLRQRCTDGHTGTSVSAPMVAGVIALALEANPLITWRDVQHLLVKTSRPVHLKAPDWKTNAAGRRVSHLYGFGLVDAEAMVLEAKKWRSVPPQHTCTGSSDRRPRYIRPEQSLKSTVTSTGCSDHAEQHVVYLEHVVVRVSIVHPRRGDLQVNLISPSGTKSQLLAKRTFDNSNDGFKNWEFLTVHCWGEKAEGEWTLEIIDSPSQLRNPESLGKLREWSLVLYGTSEHPYQSHSSRSRQLEISPEGEKSPTELEKQEIVEEEDEYNGPCHSECGDQGCDGPDADHCLNCIHFSLGNILSGRTCVSTCPLGFYSDAEVRRCRRCYKGCETCFGRAQNECTSCRRGLFFYDQARTCSATCPAGFFADDNQKQCLKCHHNCKKCFRDYDRCTACNEGFSLAGMTCVPECGDGTYFNLEEMKCSPCHLSCSTCTGPGKEECIQCARDFLQQEWKCVPACTEGYYPGEASGLPQRVCRKCEEHCVNCEGPGRYCLKCTDGYNLVGGTCVTNVMCNNADEVFCEMVKSNRLCERKLFRQFCCRTCLMTG
ncbi:proprotein convertase subtilisin/kexin type 6-like isoform X2 [Polyodon spathula]|uniref:proprotein convertase subtilisin/kexin type 6-like isoform X2 n=1 Tax=Polyodon spathula TaxID=7913 RepID=UPI001B7F491C|nr:proprotein convertase subtilisin/kexin type 6-like isoform X2 [Polyodon spathula]